MEGYYRNRGGTSLIMKKIISRGWGGVFPGLLSLQADQEIPEIPPLGNAESLG